MTTALTTYGTNTSSTTLTTACTLIANTTGGSPLAATTLVGTSNGFGEVWSQGNTAAWAGAGSIGAPTGHGYLLDVATLEGQQIIAGTWTPQVRMLVSVGTIGVDMHVRAYKRSSGGVYTQIGSTMVLAGQNISTTVATFTFSATSQPLMVFGVGDKLYIDVWLNITVTGTGSTAATLSHNASNSASQGALNNAQTTTPGYQPAQVTKTASLRTVVRSNRTRSASLRTLVRTIHSLSTGLRTLVVTSVSRTSAVRLPVRTKNAPTTGIRLLVRSTHMTVAIGGILVPFIEDTWKLSPRLDDTWRFQATVLDYTGTLTFPYESQVIVYDDSRGTLFTGLLVDDKMDKSNTYPDTTIEHQVDCVDNRRRASKRTTNRLYTAPFYAGKAVVDMVTDALAAEGVIANAVTAVTTTTADWAPGTLTNVVAASTIGDGDLELASSASLGVSYLTQTSWNSGTLASLQTNSDGTLSLIGVMRNWNNGKTNNQTLFGIADTSEKASITQGVTSNGYFYLTCPQSDASVSRMDFAGTWQNGTFEVDIKLEKDGLIYSLSYRTTNWNNVDNTYAYAVNLTTSQIVLNRGPNGGNSSTAATTIASRTFSNKLSTGWYRVRVVASGNSHTVYLNGIQRLTATDGTYTAAGYLGLRNRNTQTTGSAKDLFDNFGVLVALSGTWTSGSTSLAGVSSVTTSSISWDASLSTGGTVLVQVSLDGGTTYSACSNGGVIPGLAPGASGTGKNLVLKVTLSTTSTVLLPKIRSLVWSVVGGYTASGTRVSPALSLAPVGRAGATFISWNANLPTAATTLEVDISYDGGLTWTDVSAQNNGPLPGIFVQPDPTVDSFSSDTSLNYLYPQATALATWLYDLPNSRLVATGGSGAMFLNSTIQNADIDLFCDLDWADSGGLVWSYTDTSNYYLALVVDNQSAFSAGPTYALRAFGAPAPLASGAAGNQVALYKVSSGIKSLLAWANVSLVRGLHTRLRVTREAGVMTVSLDGVQKISYTDAAPLPAGLVGLYQDGNMSRYSQLWVQPLGDDLTNVTLTTQQILTTTDSSVSPQVTDLTIAAFGPNIDLGTLIPSADYRQKFIDKAYDDLAKQSNYPWFIDPALVLHFHHRQAYPAPWILQSNTLGLASSLEVDTNLLVENASDLYRNRQTLTGVIFTGIFQNTFSGDTKRTSFTLSYKVAPSTIPALTLNNVVQSVGKKGTTGTQWYYAEGDLTIAQDSGGTTLVSTDTLIVSYTGTYTDKLVVDNTAAQAALAQPEGGSGIVEAVEDVSQRNMTSDAALVYAQQLLARYCVVDANTLPTGRTLTAKTYRDGLAVGQALTVFVPEEHLSDVELLITAIDITMQTQPGGVALYGYVVTATELPVIARWAKLLASGLFT